MSKYEQDEDYKSKTKKLPEIGQSSSNLMISRRRMGKMGGKETTKLDMRSKVDDLFAKASFGRKQREEEKTCSNATSSKEDSLINFDTLAKPT